MNSPEMVDQEDFSPEVEADLKRWEDQVDQEIRAFLAARPSPSEDEQVQDAPTERTQV